MIELIPAEVVVRHDLREKLACNACESELVRAPTARRSWRAARSEIGLALAATLLVEKYIDGLPLHRQRERLARLGLDIAVSTLADQIKWCTDLLRPLWRASIAEVIAARVRHLDGTSRSARFGARRRAASTRREAHGPAAWARAVSPLCSRARLVGGAVASPPAPR